GVLAVEMDSAVKDPRKLFLLTTAGNYFSLKPPSSLSACTELNSFLDDANQFILATSKDGEELRFSNKVDSDWDAERLLVFFKLRPCVITEENVSRAVLVSSMVESPISTLYQTLRWVFNPALLQDEKWSHAFDPRLQSLLSELEAGLGSVLRHTSTKDSGKNLSEADVLGIVSPCDEFQYWAEVGHMAERSSERDRAAHFSELFKPIVKDYSNLDSMSLLEALDLVESTRDVLDDIWRQDEHKPYPETRMCRLLDVIGSSLGRFVQKKLSVLRLWEDPYLTVRESLREGVAVCEQWVVVCEHLTGQVWKRYSPHLWEGDRHSPNGLNSLMQRLEEVLQVRTVQEKLLHLSARQQQVSTSRVFEPFTGLNPVLYNPYTEPLWRAAVSQFERVIAPAEEEAARKLKTYIRDVQDSPQQCLQVFQKHREVIRRPTVSKELQSEREILLTRLLDYCKGLRADFESRCHGAPGEKSGPLAGRNLPEVVNNIVWVRQLLMKVESSVKMAESLLSDLPGFGALSRYCADLQEQLRAYEQEHFEDWSRDLLSGLADPKSGISLQASNRVMELDHMDGKLKIHYSERLVSLLREVRQLSALGFNIPTKIHQAANTAEKFYRQAVILKQVAHFYNVIDQQMIPSQRPMLLNYALAFEQVIKQSPRQDARDTGGKLQITWENAKELELYINRLQNAAEKLSTENRKLRKWHTSFTDKVGALMGVDLLRQQQRWKDGLQELRTGFATLESQGIRVSDMRAWRQHWNHQLYKALEYQYQVGLEALNKNLPEIHIDLVFKHGRLQFRPAFEEVRAKYYREMKRFISIPNQFKGVSEPGEESIFSRMIDRNADSFLTVYSKAEQLFSRLLTVQDTFKEWVVLGQVDMEALAEKHLYVAQDWERNFKTLKAKGKESERLPSVEKVDCITVNCEPVKAVIDDLIQKLFDTLLATLRKSIQEALSNSAEISLNAAEYGLDPAEKSPNPAEKSPNPAEKSPNPAEKSPHPAEKSPHPAEKSPHPAEKSPNPAEKSPYPAEKSPNTAEIISSTIRHIQAIDSFVTGAMETLSTRPESIDEIGDANAKHSQLQAKKPEVVPQFQQAEEKNRLLRSVAGGGLDSISSLKAKWDKFELMMESHQLMIKEQVEVMKGSVVSRVQVYLQDLQKFRLRWDQLKPSHDVIESGDPAALQRCLDTVREKKEEFNELEETRKKLMEDCEHFALEVPDVSLAYDTLRDLQDCSEMWALYEQFQNGLNQIAQQDWITFRSRTHEFEEFLFAWHDRLRKLEEHSTMSVMLQKEVDQYKAVVPVLKYVRGEHLSQDHWLDLFRLLGLPRGTTLERLIFRDLLHVAHTIIEKALELKDLNSRAHAEVSIREALRELELWGAGACFSLLEYRDSSGAQLSLIRDWREVFSQVGDNRCLLQSLKDSPYYQRFHDKVSLWETRLADLDDFLHSLNAIQRKWVYLEPIFGRGALPREQARFQRVDQDFRAIMSDVQRDSRVTSLTVRAGMRNTLVTLQDQLQRCQKSLNDFLEEKRSAFPRFYFIGDDDLLEILGQATNPTVIQTHLKKLFAGIHAVDFDSGCSRITAMRSLEGETVPLRNSIIISSDVEVWLSELSSEMKETLKLLLCECLSAVKRGGIDPNRYPSQILCLAEQIQFTEDVENAIRQQNLHQLELELVAKLEHYTNTDTSTESGESSVLQLKLKALVLDVIHNLSVVRELIQAPVHSTDDWVWTKQLRFYLNKEQRCTIHMVDAVFNYTYEYQGNAAKLVHTPLTDKCYLTLTQAMMMGLGGNPYGPAGTGKTESVKALGGLFGRQVLVFNCDEGIDVKSMGRIFVGLMKCGAWGCFDEFNRLEEAVLSAVSMQIQAIQNSLKNHSATCQLLGKAVKKAVELYEQLKQRMGVVVVGPSGAGKSTLWKLLRAALGRLGMQVKQHTLNPKAMPRHQLLGHIDMDTREWTDGVLTASARQVVREPQEVSSWIVCDGDIDPEWVESLNSVLDDNRLLTMPSGERIQFGPNVNFLFETHDLSCASPATISRMGMIFLSDEDTDVGSLLKAWLRREEEPNRANLENWISDYFHRALDWVFKQNDFVVETSLVGTVLNGLSHLRGVSERGQFVVGLIRGLGGNLHFKSRQEFAKEVLAWARESPPDPRKPLDVYYDPDSGRLRAYELQRGDGLCVEDFSNPHTLPVIQTPDTQRALHIFSHWLRSGHTQPFLLVGPEGCGKGMLLRYAFSRLRSTQVAVLHCSSQTSSLQVLQKLSQTCVCLSSSTGRVYRPKDSETLVLYLKDINLPKPDKWGTSNIITFLQQVLTYHGFYDENLEWVGLENIQIVASMSAGGALGRHALTSRFTSVVRICTIDYPDREQLQTIYSAYLSPVLQRTLGNHPTWSSAGRVHQLAGSLVQVYEQVKARFTVDDHSHYLFTPGVLTQWVLSLLRYDLTAGKCVSPADSVLEVIAYEARRLFRDRIVSSKDLNTFDNILSSVIRGDWSSDVLDNTSDTFFVTWGASHEGRSPNQPLPPHGKPLGRLNTSDLTEVIRKGVIVYGRENRELDLLLFPEVLDFMSRVDRVLGSPAGSLLLAGRSGVGRRTAVSVVSHMHGATLYTPKISRSYGLKQFKADLKTVMQLAGVEGQQTVLLLEDYQFVHPSFLEMVNSLLSSGEVPGLYSTEELEPLLLSLKDQAAQDGFTGPVFNYFSHRVQQNLHVVLIMDCTNEHFTINCESNPALYRKCSVQWMEGWSESSMKKIPEMLLAGSGEQDERISEKKRKNRSASVHAELYRSFLMIHESCREFGATPSQYLSFLRVYQSIYSTKQRDLTQRQQHLQAGVAKLNEAKSLVDELKRRAAEQSVLLKTKQAEADAALQEITQSMQNASDQKTEMEKLKGRMAQEVAKIEERKEKIDDELKEVQPLVDEAKRAVGNIKPESLSEIRSLRMPPDVIRDILEGVLRLMGIFDTSWVSMKSFLAKRGVREDIATFDARNITHEIRESVEELLHRNRASFDPKNAKRASAAAAPLAAWVKANVQYSHVLEKIQPLETEQAGLKENLRKTESRKNKLEAQLNSVGEKVLELKEKFQCRTTEAAKLEADVSRAQETISAAENLIHQLDGEHTRWSAQVDEISEELDTLPKRVQLAAAFITYLSAAPEDQRRAKLHTWMENSGLQKFDLRHFLCSESEQLIWKSEGLPSDDLSMENALVILQVLHTLRTFHSVACPFLIDPSSRATEWLRTHLKEHRLEVINQQDSNFITVLELAVRFGKTLIIQEVDGVEPVLYPLLRRDLIAQGPRYVVQIGDKVVDYNEDFRLFLATRNPSPFIPPDAASVITEVNFTTTRAGLRGQLLALTIQHEKPELESEKTKLLQQEEEKKIQLALLEESLLETLATAQGNILENKELIDSLNQTKASSALIHESLSESHRLQTALDQERDAYLPLAERASMMYFVITDLSRINNMYRFSLASFLRIFHRALQTKQESESTEVRIAALEASLKCMVYEYVCRSLFKADQLMFALHFVKGMHPELFQENEWDAFIGLIVADMIRKADSQKSLQEQIPSWIDQERLTAVALLKSTFPVLYQSLCLSDTDLWVSFSQSSTCEQEIPPTIAKKISLFQQVLVVQALRPDRLQSAMAAFASRALGMKELSPPPLNLRRVYSETVETEPVLLIISPGADPSQELLELASDTVGRENYHETCQDLSVSENVESVNSVGEIEEHSRYCTLRSHQQAPPGLKKNLLRTYESWSADQISKGGQVARAQSLFCLAWFHAVCQERRNYIPQVHSP
ncbi:hypothetical protein NFI96_027314, partial [Prochilodus magdalenae]